MSYAESCTSAVRYFEANFDNFVKREQDKERERQEFRAACAAVEQRQAAEAMARHDAIVERILG